MINIMPDKLYKVVFGLSGGCLIYNGYQLACQQREDFSARFFALRISREAGLQKGRIARKDAPP